MSPLQRKTPPTVVIDAAQEFGPQFARHVRRDSLVLAVPDAATLRALAWTRPELWRGRSIAVRIAPYTPPAPGWRPRTPALGTLTSFSIVYDPDAKTLTLALTLPQPASLAAFAQALAPLAEPLPARLADARATIAVETPDPPLQAPTLLAVPDPEGGDDSDATVPPWDLIAALGRVAEPASDAVARVHVRLDRPLIDLTVHNPIGRPPYRPARHAAVHLAGGGVRIIPDARGGRATPLMLPLNRPLTRQNVTDLHARVASLDCSGLALQPDDAGSRPAPPVTSDFAARLAELAATGVIVYGAPPAWTVGLDPELAAMVASPWEPLGVLALEAELRSFRQRRRALRGHSAAAHWFAPSDALAPPPLVAAPEVSVVLATKRPENLATILPQIAAQTYPRLEVLVGVHGEAEAPTSADMARWAGGRPLRASRFPASASLGVVLGHLSAMADGHLITKVDDDDRYGAEHVADLVAAQVYSRASIVGKALWHRFYVERNLATAARRRVSEKYTHFVPGGTMTVTRSALAEVGGWRPVARSVDRALLERMQRLGGLVYRTHGFGYVYCRYPAGHTWNPDEEAVIAASGDRWDGEAPVHLEVPGTFDPVTGLVAPGARPSVVHAEAARNDAS